MNKSRDAFRTISEVAEWLGTPAHVLRFWESKFTQVKPVKRAGGRRYYRPADMELLGGIKTLLHDEGMTIKGVQKVLREQGVKHVAALAAEPVDYDDADDLSDEIEEAPFADVPEPDDIVVPFASPKAAVPQEQPIEADIKEAVEDEPDSMPQLPFEAEPDPGIVFESEPEPEVPPEGMAQMPQDIITEPAFDLEPALAEPEDQDLGQDADTHDGTAAPIQETQTEEQAARQDALPEDIRAEDEASERPRSFEADDSDSPLPDFLQSPLEPDPNSVDDQPPQPVAATEEHSPETGTTTPEPSFMPEADDNDQTTEPAALPDEPDLDAIELAPGCLGHLSRIKYLSRAQQQDIAPFAQQLRARLTDIRQR